LEGLRPFRQDEVPASGKNLEISNFLAQSQGPLDFELGCGAGVFSLHYARENPERRLIAVEKTSEKFKRFESRLIHHEAFLNLLPLQANAISVLAHDLLEESLDRIFIWYPNPYPVKSRFIRTPFFDRVLKCLKKGGEIYFASNVEEQAQEYRALGAERWKLALLEDKQITMATMPNFKPRTLFEKKYFLRGETLHQLKFGKTESLIY
jgi:tRNA (guanine-N7-)-methyltransferase